MISWENYEEYIMMYADGELGQEEVCALMEFVNKHPALKKELEAYSMATLQPDKTIVYADKKTLAKPVPVVTKRAIPVWIKYSIAAGIMALLFMSILKFVGTNDNRVEVKMAGTDSGNKAVTPEIKQHEEAISKVSQPEPYKQQTASENQKKESVGVTRLAIKSTKSATRPNSKPETRSDENKQPTDRILAVQKTEMNSLVVAGLVPMPAEVSSINMVTIDGIPNYQPAAEEVGKRTLWSMLPIDEMKKKKMEHVAGDLAQAYKDVHTAKQELEDKTVSIRVEKRKILISF